MSVCVYGLAMNFERLLQLLRESAAGAQLSIRVPQFLPLPLFARRLRLRLVLEKNPTKRAQRPHPNPERRPVT